jgi:hypothetical protein
VQRGRYHAFEEDVRLLESSADSSSLLQLLRGTTGDLASGKPKKAMLCDHDQFRVKLNIVEFRTCTDSNGWHEIYENL